MAVPKSANVSLISVKISRYRYDSMVRPGYLMLRLVSDTINMANIASVLYRPWVPSKILVTEYPRLRVLTVETPYCYHFAALSTIYSKC